MALIICNMICCTYFKVLFPIVFNANPFGNDLIYLKIVFFHSDMMFDKMIAHCLIKLKRQYIH